MVQVHRTRPTVNRAGFLSAGTTRAKCGVTQGKDPATGGKVLRRPGGFQPGHGRRQPQAAPAALITTKHRGIA